MTQEYDKLGRFPVYENEIFRRKIQHSSTYLIFKNKNHKRMQFLYFHNKKMPLKEIVQRTIEMSIKNSHS